MKKNMGSADRTVRIVVAVGLAVLYFTGTISGTLGIIGLVVAIVLLLTALSGSCLLYMPFRMSTRKSE